MIIKGLKLTPFFAFIIKQSVITNFSVGHKYMHQRTTLVQLLMANNCSHCTAYLGKIEMLVALIS